MLTFPKVTIMTWNLKTAHMQSLNSINDAREHMYMFKAIMYEVFNIHRFIWEAKTLVPKFLTALGKVPIHDKVDIKAREIRKMIWECFLKIRSYDLKNCHITTVVVSNF